MKKVTYIDNGSGFSGIKEIGDDLTLGEFLASQGVAHGSAKYLVRLNGESDTSADDDISEWDRITVSPTNVKGAC